MPPLRERSDCRRRRHILRAIVCRRRLRRFVFRRRFDERCSLT